MSLDDRCTRCGDVGATWELEGFAFTPDPFMLTMYTEKAKIEGLQVTPCAATPTKGPAPKKGAPKKK